MTENTDDKLFEFVLRRFIEARDAEIDRVIVEGDGKARPKGLVAKRSAKDGI